MAGALFSQHWHRVANLRLRLRRHARIHRHEYRGRAWYVLHDSLTGQVHRFTPEAYQIIGRLDGRRSLRDIWDQVSVSLGDAMPTQQELIALVGRLHSANVLAGEGDIDINELANRQRKHRRGKWLQVLKSPLGIRIPLLDPERFVAASYPWVRPLLSPFGALLWLAVVGLALVVAAWHWSALSANVADRVLGLENLLLLGLVYPVVKCLHELGHAWTVKHAGGEVHEIGVMLLVFFPVPYVDASAAAACPDKHLRMLVGAAGILVEVFLAALAMLVWAMAEPGALRAVAFNVILIAGVSTLLFNGNPLLRFDAYYVLADYLEIPNLGARANQQLAYTVKRYLLGRRDVTSQADSRREVAWLVSYAIVSFVYRLILMVAVATLVATRYLFIGILLAGWSVFMTLGLPLCKLFKTMTIDTQLAGARGKAWAWLIAGVTLAGVLLFGMPVPYATHIEGVIESREPAQLRLGASGELVALASHDGARVAPGDVILRVAAPELDGEVRLLEATLEENRQRLLGSVRDPAAAAVLRESIRFVEQRLADARQRRDATTLVSQRAGWLSMAEGEPKLGSYLERGSAVAAVIRPEDLQITALIPAYRIDAVREDTRGVALRRIGGETAPVAGTLVRLAPTSTRRIPHPALAINGGGNIALDPDAEQPLTAFRRYYAADFSAASLLGGNAPLRLGERVHVRIEHTPEPVGLRLLRGIRRSFLSLFDV